MLNHAAPAFKPTAYFKPETKQAQIPKKAENTQVSPFGEAMATSLDSFNLNNNFTPSTPHVHKFRTEMCKNYELYGKCKYGDEVSQNFYQFQNARFSNFLYLFILFQTITKFKLSGFIINNVIEVRKLKLFLDS